MSLFARRLGRLRPPLVRCAATMRTQGEDIVVIGGGPAGLVLASALASSSTISSTNSIALVEGSDLDRIKNWQPGPGEWSNRVSSITEESREFLESIGVWENVEQERVRPVEGMVVWDGLTDARLEFDPLQSNKIHHSTDVPIMATMVENINIQRACLRTLAQNNIVKILDNSRVAKITRERDWPVVTIDKQDSSTNIRTRLLIGADGAKSPVKSYSNIETFGRGYDIHGVVGTLKLAQNGPATAWQRFLPEGPVAFLPLCGDYASMVWSTSPPLAAKLKLVPIEALPSLINAVFQLPWENLREIYDFLLSRDSYQVEDLAKVIARATPPETFQVDEIVASLPPLVTSVQPGSIASFPLVLSHTSSYLGLPENGIDLRTALVGDAGHTVNPLAGQGLNMGIGDVKSITKVIEDVVCDGGDIGAYLGLKRYPYERYLKNHVMLSVTDHLSDIFKSQTRPLIWARSTGMEVLNELGTVKDFLMKNAGAARTQEVQGLLRWMRNVW